MKNFFDLLFIAGCGFIVYNAYMISPNLAGIFLGVMLAGLSWWMHK